MVAQESRTTEYIAQPEARERVWRLTRAQGQRWSYFACKRLLDILIAGSLLIALAPLMLVIAVLVKLDSPGPAIFKQTRVGTRRRRNGRGEVWGIETFTFYKFRSMRRDADPELHRAFVKALILDDEETMAALQLKCREAAPGPHPAIARSLPSKRRVRSRSSGDDERLPHKLTHDPRVTRLGKTLRETSLDELPQLWNVLKGEMSLVGPRPDLPYSVADYRPWHYERLNAKPGLTGLWQVKGRSEVSWEDLVRMDIEYVRDQSLWLDVKILMRTPLAVLRGDGAV